ncbi:FAD-dependent monooxygenase sdcF [Cladobotryum mycophilum]|uniref:FAD-dependent monooxygenase sdcF n=1 Tax=Cladobotryum mycophilum TaxID=491253 RepID=A0ABR0SPG2_9HYPO
MTDVQSSAQSKDILSQQAEPLAQAGLRSRLLLPSDANYTSRIDSYWCNNAKLRPACIIQPQSAAEVSKAVTALAQSGQQFAVRAGGHGNWVGANNINDGVTIDLGLLNSTQYDTVTKTAQIEPGAKWKDVYAELEKHGVVVAGAREGEVGVGGFLLGGGNTFHTPRYGLGCDNVLSFEVVLADGRIITAEAGGQHADLFRVLKGGGNNFGIVTRFTMRTFPSGPIWGGLALRPLETVQAGAEALVEFTANSANDPDTTVQFIVGHMPRFGGTVAGNSCSNVANIENPPSLQKTIALPEIMNNFKSTTMQELLTYSALPPNYYNIWFTMTFKNDVSIVVKTAELHNQMVKELQELVPDQDFTSHVAFQPIPRLFAQLGANSGGNVLGLEQSAHDAILLQISASVRTPELEELARPKVRAVLEGVRAFASTIEGGFVPWVYLNYAHATQEVLQSYGPDNVRKIREAAVKYDPEGVFQRLCPGGFKISAIKD